MRKSHQNNAPYDTKTAATPGTGRQIWFGLGLIFLTLGALGASARAGDSVHQQSRSVTLVELYTSQGCSSCPPADQFLKDLSGDPDVLPLSFHVDYWNSAQWRDPFSRKAFSLRQKAYHESLETDYVYTPQMVVSGRYALPGGQRSAVMEAIEKSPAPVSQGAAPLILEKANDRIEITLPASSATADSTLYLAVYHTQQTTRIRGGENRGRTLRNANIVKRLISLANLSGEALSFNFARSDLDALPSDGIAVFVQSDTNGMISAASALAGYALPSAQAKLAEVSRSTVR